MTRDNMKRLILISLLLTSQVYAADVTLPTTYADGDTVTAANLNANPVAIAAVVNGGLDNDNANTASGYRFYEFKATLPSAGTQGRAVFQASDNTFNLDNGSAWLATVTPTGTLATGKIPYYNGGWTLLTPGSQYYSLVSNGASSLPTYQQVSLTQGVTNTLPIANGGTGQVTAQAAVDALLPSQTSNGTKVLTTNGSASSWQFGGLTLKSTTTVSAATTSGAITLTAGKAYKIIAKLQTTTAGDTIGLRFNADSGANYTYIRSGYANGANIVNARTLAATQITLNSNTISSNQPIEIVFDILPNQGAGFFASATGRIRYIDNTGGDEGFNDFVARYTGASSIISFTISSGSNMSGTIWTYEYSGT